MNRAPGNAEGCSVEHCSPRKRNEERNRDSTISTARDLSKCEEFPGLTEEALCRLEHGIREISLDVVKLLSRIDAAIARLTSERGIVFTTGKSQQRVLRVGKVIMEARRK